MYWLGVSLAVPGMVLLVWAGLSGDYREAAIGAAWVVVGFWLTRNKRRRPLGQSVNVRNGSAYDRNTWPESGP